MWLSKLMQSCTAGKPTSDVCYCDSAATEAAAAAPVMVGYLGLG
jgi:hypothetical protein